MARNPKAGVSVADRMNDYDGFVEKFKPKKTTDDCYTPPAVYDAVVGWCRDERQPSEPQPSEPPACRWS